jgi:hypothetical protein
MRTRLITVLVVLLVGAGTAAAATAPPRNTVRPTISGTARQGDLLVADPGSWSGTQPMTFTYQWRRCDTDGSSCSNIIGATGKTYTVTSADVGNGLRVRVRATNSVGSATATSPARSVVATETPKKSVSLRAGQSTVVYGRALSLFGSVANGSAGESVTITEQRLPSFSSVQTVATLQTATDGSFSTLVRPEIRTLYRATDGQATSNTIAINVRPRLSLTRLGFHRFSLRALAARSFAGRYAVLQRFSLRSHRWISVKRVYFTRSIASASPTITSRVVFRARFGHRTRIRTYVPRNQVSAGYVSGVSNVASA